MTKEKIKNEIQDLKIILNKKIPTELRIHERIEVYTKIYTEIMDSLEYKQFKKAYIEGKYDNMKSIINELPKDKQPFFEKLIRYDLEFFDKIQGKSTIKVL